MIDIHTHILPGLDDGSGSWEDSLAMARISVDSGVSGLVATPHSGLPDRDPERHLELVNRRLAQFRTRLQEEKIPLVIYGGMEIFGTPDTPLWLRRGLLITLNHSRYVLIEFPFRDYGRQSTGILEAVRALSLVPVVAHPERYRYVQEDPRLLNLWTDMGCLLQVNRGSLLGRFGETEQALSMGMLERGFVFTVASDTHSPRIRTPRMQDIQRLLREICGEKAAHRMLDTRPRRLLNNEVVSIPEPEWF